MNFYNILDTNFSVVFLSCKCVAIIKRYKNLQSDRIRNTGIRCEFFFLFFSQGSKIWQEVKEAKDAESEHESVSSEPAKEEEEEEVEEEEKKEEEGDQENSQILDTVMKARLPNSIYFY
jgi:hypothetical protein